VLRGELRQFFRRCERQRPARKNHAGFIEVAAPADVDWDIHRVATSRHYADGLTVIQTQWSLDDLYEAHEVLDMYDELERRVEAERQRGARR